MIKKVKKVGVVGAGQMGNGIAHVLAQHGYDVSLCDISDAQLARALATIRKNLERQAGKGLVAAGQIGGILDRIVPTTDLHDQAAVDFVVEAVPENETLKLDIFRKLDEVTPQGVILATNTSSISITSIAAVTRRPERVIGMHFMNPVPVMRLVEVIRSEVTSEATFEATAALVTGLGKELVLSRDSPGFIVNRILIPMINEAIFALHDRIATAADIDKGMQLGANLPMGPLALADFIGLDTVLAITNVLYDGFNDPKYRPCPLLVKMVASGNLGRKTGRGFYEYQSADEP